MNDFFTVFHVVCKHKIKLFIFIVLAWFCFFLSGGEHLEYVTVSPDKGYRLEHYTPRRYQLLLHPTMESPGFVRLYNNHSNRYFGESEVVDFFAEGFPTMWHMDIDGTVAASMSVRYENIPPLDSFRRELPIPVYSFLDHAEKYGLPVLGFNSDGTAILSKTRDCEIKGQKIVIPSDERCDFYNPVLPQCNKDDSSEDNNKVCKIESILAFEKNYQNWLFSNLYDCSLIEYNLKNNSGTADKYLANLYALRGCGPYNKLRNSLNEPVQSINPS